jgi:EAL domain-containing protein (putative c-di-GMP-specific phosphodiesterase class I)
VKKTQQNLNFSTLLEAYSRAIAERNYLEKKLQETLRELSSLKLALKQAAIIATEISDNPKTVFFDSSIPEIVLRKVQLETELKTAIAQEQFRLEYQPLVSLKDKSLAGFEALVRWRHPILGNIPPCQFIPIADETGTIIELGELVLRQACWQMRSWQEKFQGKTTRISVAVNVSAKQFLELNLLEKVDKIILETGVDASCLNLEITESSFLDGEGAIATLYKLKKRGIKLSIDDFGTGYSCLSYLHRFPIDVLKIDRSFIRLLGKRKEAEEIMKAMATLAHNLNMELVAEGIETTAQLEKLQQLECEYGQGFLFAKALTPKAAEELIISGLNVNK